VFSPQLVLVPLLQAAINRRVERRIETLREVSGGIVGAAAGNEPVQASQQNRKVDRVFRLNMGVFKLKFTMNFVMNLMHHLGVAAVLEGSVQKAGEAVHINLQLIDTQSDGKQVAKLLNLLEMGSDFDRCTITII